MSRPTVVILLSDKRSGSTILQTEFLSHPDVRGLDYTSHTYLESHHWLKAAVMTGQPDRLFSAGQIYPGYGGARNARTYMIDTITGNLPDFVPPQDDRDLVFEGWEALCQHYAKPVFFEKSPQVLANWASVIMLLEWVKKTSFDVRLVGLVRNPLAVQHSAQLLFGSVPVARQYGWAETHRNLLALRQMLPEDRLMLLRHEDILADPQARFADLCRYVGLENSDGMGQQITARTQDRWKDDPDYTLRLHPSVVHVAKALGYHDDELQNPNAQAEPDLGVTPQTISWKLPSLSQAKNKFRDRVARPYLMRRRTKFR
jgi:hypothetical protein